MRRRNFFSFDTPAGGVFLRCFASECFTAEGTTREVFDAMTHAMKWPDAPSGPARNRAEAGCRRAGMAIGARAVLPWQPLIQILPASSLLPIR